MSCGDYHSGRGTDAPGSRVNGDKLLFYSREILPPGTLDLYPGRITMKIHEPIDISKFPGDDMGPLIEHVRSVIKNGLEDLK